MNAVFGDTIYVKGMTTKDRLKAGIVKNEMTRKSRAGCYGY